jgi:hypothetical protein
LREYLRVDVKCENVCVCVCVLWYQCWSSTNVRTSCTINQKHTHTQKIFFPIIFNMLIVSESVRACVCKVGSVVHTPDLMCWYKLTLHHKSHVSVGLLVCRCVCMCKH